MNFQYILLEILYAKSTIKWTKYLSALTDIFQEKIWLCLEYWPILANVTVYIYRYKYNYSLNSMREDIQVCDISLWGLKANVTSLDQFSKNGYEYGKLSQSQSLSCSFLRQMLLYRQDFEYACE